LKSKFEAYATVTSNTNVENPGLMQNFTSLITCY